MITKRKTIGWGLVASLILLIVLMFVPDSRADDDHRKSSGEGGRHRDHDEDEEHEGGRSRGERDSRDQGRWVFTMKDAVEPVTNAEYKKECGACHLAFQPALLPAYSWVLLLTKLEDHFGHDASLPDETRREILTYAAQNAADTSHGEPAYKILRSLGGVWPLRITEVPYIRHKHDEIAPAVLRRKSVGSLSNCSACHRTAEQGVYDEDNVVIPR